MLKFKTIGLMGRVQNDAARETFSTLMQLLQKLGLKFVVERQIATELGLVGEYIQDVADLAQTADMVVVVGGDGSMLHAARALVDYDLPIVGINRGRVGFLADITPDDVEVALPEILAGKYTMEPRMMLEVELPQQSLSYHAFNDIVLGSGDTAHMTEFEVYVDNVFMSSEYSDGIIVATPTGSTAYALSGGGPIVHPASSAIMLLPMFSHNLTSRPVVLSERSEICFQIGTKVLASSPYISCDGVKLAELKIGEKVIVRRKQKMITLLHPENYTYFDTLGRKLYWGKKLAQDN